MIAKASTTCTYSLDPITLSPGNSTKPLDYRNTSRACAILHPRITGQRLVDTITTLCRSASILGWQCSAPRLKTTNRHTLLLQIVKEQPMHQPKLATSSGQKTRAKQATFALAWLWPFPTPFSPPPSQHRFTGGGERDRTDDLMLAKHALSQLSYTPADLLHWWVWMDSNHRPPPYQDGALTN